MGKINRFYLILTFTLLGHSNLFAQEKKENNMFNQKVQSILPELKSDLDSARKEHRTSLLNPLDLIDKSSLLDLEREKDHYFKLPNDTSYIMRRITILRMFHNAESQRYGKVFNKIYKNILPDAFINNVRTIRPSGFSGCFDPVELIRNKKREKQIKKNKAIRDILEAINPKDSLQIHTDTLQMTTKSDKVQE